MDFTKTTPPPDLMTVRDFSVRYSVSLPTVYRLRARGELAFVKVGRATRIRRVDAERWAAGLTEAGK